VSDPGPHVGDALAGQRHDPLQAASTLRSGSITRPGAREARSDRPTAGCAHQGTVTAFHAGHRAVSSPAGKDLEVNRSGRAPPGWRAGNGQRPANQQGTPAQRDGAGRLALLAGTLDPLGPFLVQRWTAFSNALLGWCEWGHHDRVAQVGRPAQDEFLDELARQVLDGDHDPPRAIRRHLDEAFSSIRKA
jgi:hypothetical protein